MLRFYFEVARTAYQRQLIYRWANLAGLLTNTFWGIILSSVIIALYHARPAVGGYCAWLQETEPVAHDPAKVVRLVEQEDGPPRHLSDQEEHVLVAAVTATGNLRDRAIILLLLHTGLRAHEVCSLMIRDVRLARRSGTLSVLGKRNKYREVPLNATARAVLAAYLPTVRPGMYLFPSPRTGDRSPNVLLDTCSTNMPGWPL